MISHFMQNNSRGMYLSLIISLVLSAQADLFAMKRAAPSSDGSSSSEERVSPRKQKFAKATTDVAFKQIFTTESDQDMLISFLTTFTGEQIKSVKFQPLSVPAIMSEDDKRARKQTLMDFACITHDNAQIIAEVQVRRQDYWDSRALYYLSGVFSQQLKKGEPWSFLTRAISINLLGFDREDLPTGEYKRDYMMTDALHPDRQLQDLRLVQFELPRIPLEEVQDIHLRHWLRLFKEADTMDAIPEDTPPAIRKAYERIDIERWGSALKQDYSHELNDLDNYSEALHQAESKGEEKEKIRKYQANLSLLKKTGMSIEDFKAISDNLTPEEAQRFIDEHSAPKQSD